jgi:dihydrodipicolinate synthase/N-acetylneuraminate lyase
MALIGEDNVRTHVTAPIGLPGGYPALIGDGQIQLDLPEGLGKEAAVALNEEALRCDGIDRIETDGTVVYTADAGAAMSELGIPSDPVAPTELPERSTVSLPTRRTMPEFVRKPLVGLFPLIPLSLDADEEIDFDGIRRSIALVAGSGAPGCIVFGSMGQMTSISEREFNAVCDVAVQAGHEGGIAVVVGSTASYQREAVRRARYAEEAGADGSMLAAPYALPLTPTWAMDFFVEVAESLAGDMALMVYNYSPLNGLNVTPQMWERLIEIDNIKAIKESNTALPHLDEVLLTIADRINVFTGNDPAFFHGSMLGATGATGIFSWAGMKTGTRFVDECLKGNHHDLWVRSAFEALQHLSATIRRPGMPSMLSHEHGYLNALSALGGASAGSPRKPYRDIPDEAVAELRKSAEPLMAIEAEL